MSPRSLTRFADRVITTIAGRQHGIVARWQLLDAGVTPDQIKLRLRSGRLHELHRGVYLVGHTAPPPYAREMAALLACGPNAKAALSHRSAASLWKLLPYPAPGDVCITLPPERSTRRPRIEIHRTALEPRDIRQRHGMPLTSPPRTILDLAGALAGRKPAHAASAGEEPATERLDELERLVAEAHYRRLASEAELRDQLERNPGKPGVRALRAVLDQPGGPQRTRSRPERAMLRLLRRAEITGYEANAPIHGYEVDFLWRELAFAVELDGYEAHAGRVAFERDRLKVATLKARGLDVMPVTPRQVRDDPEGVVARLLAALDSRARRGRKPSRSGDAG